MSLQNGLAGIPANDELTEWEITNDVERMVKSSDTIYLSSTAFNDAQAELVEALRSRFDRDQIGYSRVFKSNMRSWGVILMSESVALFPEMALTSKEPIRFLLDNRPPKEMYAHYKGQPVTELAFNRNCQIVPMKGRRIYRVRYDKGNHTGYYEIGPASKRKWENLCARILKREQTASIGTLQVISNALINAVAKHLKDMVGEQKDWKMEHYPMLHYPQYAGKKNLPILIAAYSGMVKRLRLKVEWNENHVKAARKLLKTTTPVPDGFMKLMRRIVRKPRAVQPAVQVAA